MCLFLSPALWKLSPKETFPLTDSLISTSMLVFPHIRLLAPVSRYHVFSSPPLLSLHASSTAPSSSFYLLPDFLLLGHTHLVIDTILLLEPTCHHSHWWLAVNEFFYELIILIARLDHHLVTVSRHYLKNLQQRFLS